MRRGIAYIKSHLIEISLVISLILFLVVLSWGITTSNIVASMISGAGLAVIIVFGSSILLVPDNQRAQSTERTLRMASGTLEYLRGGLTPENCAVICQLLLPETSARCIAITDDEKVLAYAGDTTGIVEPGTKNTDPTREVLASKRVETFIKMDSAKQTYRRITQSQGNEGRAFGIIVPLIVKEESVGTIKLYYAQGSQMDRTQQAIARGLGDLLSTQLSSYELDRQSELTARAEVKALQAQINPHFLFNALNTMAALTRTDPNKARELMREFAVFYRRTLEGTESLIPIIDELEQVRRYLKIEKARLGEERIIETEYVESGCEQVPVPAFIVQPIVENAVRHAMRDEGPLRIDVHVAKDGDDILIAVADDGVGMSDDTADRLLGTVTSGGTAKSEGMGIALRNVAERVERFFAAGSGVEIVSRPGEGTCVTLRLTNAARGIGHALVGLDGDTSV